MNKPYNSTLLTIARWKIPPTGPSVAASFSSLAAPSGVDASWVSTRTFTPALRQRWTHKDCKRRGKQISTNARQVIHVVFFPFHVGYVFVLLFLPEF